MPGEHWVGKYKHVSHENWEPFMIAAGFPKPMVKIAMQQSPSVEIVVDGDKWTITNKTTLKTHKVEFTLGQESEQSTPDGRKAKMTATLEGDNKLIAVCKPLDAETVHTITRELKGDEIHVTGECNGVVGKRVFKKA